jgi:uroporphyrinogen decarboxylase
LTTPKERLKRAFSHQPVDCIPTQVNTTRAMAEKMAASWGLSFQELDAYLDNHLLRVGIDDPGRLSEDGQIHFDWWGVGFDTQEEGYFTTYNPLGQCKDLDAYPWPDPEEPHLLDQAAVWMQADHNQHFVVPNFGWALFERAWSLRGFETFLMDLALDMEFSEELLERITAIQLVLIRRFIDLGVDGGYFGDDYGAQKNMLFSPKTWRALIKPRLARLFAPFREAGLPIILHSDGQIVPVLPDLVEIGLTVLNPVQPEVIDPAWLKITFGDRLAYYGGISTQTVLPYGSPGEVREAVRKCIEKLAPGGTGLLLAPSHRLMSDIPLKNVAALLDAFEELK